MNNVAPFQADARRRRRRRFLDPLDAVAGPELEVGRRERQVRLAAASKSPAAVDEFEENRRAHMQKSKENNAKKGAE